MRKGLAVASLVLAVVLLGVFATERGRQYASALRTKNRIASKHIVELRAKLAENPDDYFAWTDLARYYGVLRRYPEALDAHARAIALLPYHVDFRLFRVDTLMAAQRYREALSDLELLEARGYSRSDRPYDLFDRKVAIFLAGGDFSAAERYILSRFDPRDAHHWERLGTTRLRQGRRREALRDYQEALRIDPARASLRQEVGRLRSEGIR
jgi:cytochrome c-type biogenesis protein CcmH/NrfG